MSLIEIFARASVHLVIFDKETEKPIQYGSGCFAWYRGKLFLLSVEHVVRVEGRETYARIDTGLPAENGKTPFYQTGPLVTFDMLKAKQPMLEGLETLEFEKDDPLDITFTEVGSDIKMMQRNVSYLDVDVSGGGKIVFNLDDTADPSNDDYFGFFGQIKHDIYDENFIMSYGVFKLDLDYTGTTKEGYHNFLYPEVIADESDFEGTSGAPIINSGGQLVGLASSVLAGSRSVFGFSISYCKRLIDVAIQEGLV